MSIVGPCMQGVVCCRGRSMLHLCESHDHMTDRTGCVRGAVMESVRPDEV